MIQQKELYNRLYDGKICVGFTYDLVDKETKEVQRILFNKDKGSIWKVSTLFRGSYMSVPQFYEVEFTPPKENISLVMVASIGLKWLQAYMKSELDYKMGLVLLIEENTKDMKG